IEMHRAAPTPGGVVMIITVGEVMRDGAFDESSEATLRPVGSGEAVVVEEFDQEILRQLFGFVGTEAALHDDAADGRKIGLVKLATRVSGCELRGDRRG